MAEARIVHFRDFDSERALGFARHVMQTVGAEVYGLPYGEVTTKNVTLIVQTVGPGSQTSAESGTEVRVDIDGDEWPRDESGNRQDTDAAEQKVLRLKQSIGQALLDGVEGPEGAIVNVNVRQFLATGWYGIGYQQPDPGSMQG